MIFKLIKGDILNWKDFLILSLLIITFFIIINF